jgi:hypothetical protein
VLKAAKCYEILLAVLFRAHQYRREKKRPFVKANVDSLEGQGGFKPEARHRQYETA